MYAVKIACERQDELGRSLSRWICTEIARQLVRGGVVWRVSAEIFHGKRRELRQHYREGQEDQLRALGLVINAVVLWNTRYLDAALAQVRAFSSTIKPEDIERLSSLLIDHVNVPGRHEFAMKESVRQE
jgi:hypothetical protein